MNKFLIENIMYLNQELNSEFIPLTVTLLTEEQKKKLFFLQKLCTWIFKNKNKKEVLGLKKVVS